MRGLVSESMVISGTYLLSVGQPVLGGVVLGFGITGGIVSYLIGMTIEQNKEKRSIEIFEILKSAANKFFLVVQDINETVTRGNRTVH